MPGTRFEEVARLAEQLRPDEQQALVEHLQNLSRSRQLSAQEKRALFETLIVDLGPWPEGWSFRRRDCMATSAKAFV
jgi:hypothetical protein